MNEVNPSEMIRYPMSVGDLVNLSFDHYKRNFIFHWIPFLIISVILFLITPVITGLILPDDSLFADFVDPNSTELPPGFINAFGAIVASLIVIAVIEGALLSIPVTISVIITKKSFNNQPIVFSEIIQDIMPNLPIILIVGGFVSFISMIGFVLFGVGIFITVFIFSVWYSVAMVVIALEDNSLGALGKSRDLISGSFMATLGALLAIGIIQYLISFLLDLAIGFFPIGGETYLFLATIGLSVAQPLTGISIFFIHLNLKWKKENVQRYGYQQAPGGYQTVDSRTPPYQQSQYQDQQQQTSSGYQSPPAFQQSTQPTVPPSSTSSKFCGSCGTPALNPEDKFCNSCGTKYNV